jgi:hypothetical protein
MPIDPTGTEPGIVPNKEKPAEVLMRCKNESCGSITAIEITPPNLGGARLYQCVKCKRTHGIQVGGAFEL